MPRDEGIEEEQKRGMTKGHEETFEGDGYVYYLDDGDGFTGIYKTNQTIY